jgi:hypothetical protein
MSVVLYGKQTKNRPKPTKKGVLFPLHQRGELAGFRVVGEEFGGGDAGNPLPVRSFSERLYPAKRDCYGICPEASAVFGH